MSVSQNHVKPNGALASVNVLHCFKSSHFLLLSLVLLITFAGLFWVQTQATERAIGKANLQQQSTVAFTQDALAIQSASQDIATIITDIKQAMLSLDKQQAMFLDSHQFFLANTVFQEASYSQSLVINTFRLMATLDAAIAAANSNATEYQFLSSVHADHLANIQTLQSQSDQLGRAFYKLSWKFDELTTALSKTLQLTRSRGFDVAINHFASVGGQKVNAMDSGVYSLDQKLQNLNATIDETLLLVDQALANASKPTAAGIGQSDQLSIGVLFSGFFVMMMIWFNGVTKPGVRLTQSAQALNQTGQFNELANSKGEWGSLSTALEQIAQRHKTLQAQYSEKSQELELLKLNMLSAPFITSSDDASEDFTVETSLLADSVAQQKSLPGFEQQHYRLN